MSTYPSEQITYEELENMDVISVELVPERKGLILKHCEYYVSSRRHGTTVTRRYNDFVQLHDVLFVKYPYRAISRLPPKRVVVGGGSTLFLQRRRAALERWLTLIARHPVLAHDADLRVFLCEVTLKLEKPKHDEFMLAGTPEATPGDMSTEEMQAAFQVEQEQLRVLQLGLARVYKIIERVEGRLEEELSDIRELGAGLSALSSSTVPEAPVRQALKAAALLATEVESSVSEDHQLEESRVLCALDQARGWSELCARLSRGLHAERAAAASRATVAAQPLRDRLRYSLRCALQEACLCRAYALSSLSSLPDLFRRHGQAKTSLADLWADLRKALRTDT